MPTIWETWLMIFLKWWWQASLSWGQTQSLHLQWTDTFKSDGLQKLRCKGLLYPTPHIHREERKELPGVTLPQNSTSSSCTAEQSFFISLRIKLKASSLVICCAVFQERKKPQCMWEDTKGTSTEASWLAGRRNSAVCIQVSPTARGGVGQGEVFPCCTERSLFSDIL